MRKLIYLAAGLLLTFAAASGATRRESIKMVYVPQANGDYRLYIFGSDRQLVCEEKPVTVAEQPDAV
ncbi:MAG: hypothetical protein KGJ13_11730, partial [Patescibacteria group bacterium]|nr:hypothetical protein [Patescibacteria group bacterium]